MKGDRCKGSGLLFRLERKGTAHPLWPVHFALQRVLDADLSTPALAQSNPDVAYVLANTLSLGRSHLSQLASRFHFACRSSFRLVCTQELNPQFDSSPHSMSQARIQQERETHERDQIVLICSVVLSLLLYLLFLWPVVHQHIAFQALSLRLFLAVPRTIAVRQFRKYRRKGGSFFSSPCDFWCIGNRTPHPARWTQLSCPVGIPCLISSWP